jgi:hypothetical protein
MADQTFGDVAERILTIQATNTALQRELAELKATNAGMAKDANRARDKLFCAAIIATMDSSGPRLMCDVEKLLHHFNTHRPDKDGAALATSAGERKGNTDADR